MSVHHVCANVHKSQKKELDSVRLELHVVVSASLVLLVKLMYSERAASVSLLKHLFITLLPHIALFLAL